MNQTFSPGERWLDTSGQPIQAHGGALLRHCETWYWYGEDKTAHVNSKVTTVTGVSCYRSTDLLNWENCGLCLTAESDPASPLHASKIVERPKVLFNALTGKFVMWIHLDASGYTFSHAGIAIADRPEGPFKLIRVQRSFSHDYGYPPADPRRQRELGNAYLDMNLFLDDDGQAYVFHVSENLMTLYVSQLSDDFTDFRRPEKLGVTWNRALVNRLREGPAPFKHAGQYYLFTSGCTFWDPNATLLARAPHPLGPWEVLGEPFIGPGAVHSHRSQPTSVFAMPGAPAGSFVFMADRWMPRELRDTRHVWLPFVVRDGTTTLDFRRQWDASIFNPRPAPAAPTLQGALRHANSVFNPVGVRLEWQPVPGADGYRVYADGVAAGFTDNTFLELPLPLPGVALAYTVRAEALAGGQSPDSNPVNLSFGKPRLCHLSDFEPVRAFTCFGELVRDRAWDGEALRLGERDFSKGLLAHIDSDLVYLLGGAYAGFTATVGLHAHRADGKACFSVEADDCEIFRSELLSATGQPVSLNLSVAGVRRLRLRAWNRDTIESGHAVWADPLLHPSA
jgi:hypothetical protein